MANPEESGEDQTDKECRQKPVPDWLARFVELAPKRERQDESNPKHNIGGVMLGGGHGAHRASLPLKPNVCNGSKAATPLMAGMGGKLPLAFTIT
jgi:hypothetical protein